GACDNPTRPARAITPLDATSRHDATGVFDASIRQDLAALRALTAPFHDLERASASGWSTQITSCLDSPLGAMGFHYGNVAYIDGQVSVLQPELLMYEPERDGRFRFLGVEYIVPLSAWTDPTPPMLFGREFHVNSDFGVWALHVWVGRENPLGLFADWNPKVSCAAAF
ncbi:MAG TPA: hypothetical protein VLN49_01330, partial [Gemmatimonadaceae bacterium]|nr:hypothetical protein [Gemmatimonadaceae bacterium]